jgi:hypothetical protein
VPPTPRVRGTSRRREARLLVAPFADALIEAHFEGQSGRVPRELVQDLSSRAVSFFTSNSDLVTNAARIRSVTVACPDGFAVTLGVSAVHVRPVAEGAPSRVALEFEHARPSMRTLASMQRLADGLYAPRKRADALQLVRAMLGADPTVAERRVTERIRVPLEDKILVSFVREGQVVGEAVLADVAPLGFGCIAEEGFTLSDAADEVRLHLSTRELLRRRVREVLTMPVVVRGETRTRIRIVIEPEQGPSTWTLPAWIGPREFGAVRLQDSGSGSLVQSAMLARGEVKVSEAHTPEDLSAALDLSHAAFVEDGFVDGVTIPRARWADAFDPHAIVLIARASDLVAGTIRLVRETDDQGLPHRVYCPEAYWPERRGTRVEASRLAVSHAYRPDVNGRLGVAVLLVTEGYRRCVADGFEFVVMAARLSQEPFYKALGFRPVSPPFKHQRWGFEIRMFELTVAEPGPLLRASRKKK